MTGWSHFPHGADVGLRGQGPTIEVAFEEIALALTAVVTDPAGVKAEERIMVECEAPDAELLLVDWLNAIIFEMATRRMLFACFEVKIAGSRLRGTAWGEPVDVGRHRPAAEPKGATLTAVRVAESDGWVAECVVDV